MGVPNKVLTLVLIREEYRILLGMKKRGFGVNRWNGFGGKVEAGETIAQGAKREVEEECGLTLTEFEEVGRIDFEFVGEPQILEVHIFRGDKYEGELQETEEMRPEWFALDAIPFHSMWPDDAYWFPIFLRGSKFKGYIKFEGHDKILDCSLEELETTDSNCVK
ncbi:7,8-dihydro-8-oxoguanine triphosphatase-like [Patiria miniata]|uniref:Oxidized purine nucleoside triphosphate hydrolase n=1 Tax=Patiria miniata TaxID=46514 RepID=A0A914AJS6_PATMI|nr:7,8-dihydro-8-oxoguanine triphosphatase-like [Patiria miniata]XP_038063982.1 7,8-dihydro-8-oxoguanine triphosphatase-like [Patiria miniata]XP_038063983.1 7,8-dihydro-8-oxoguanine triphosphatase-like [Patiria miniata]